MLCRVLRNRYFRELMRNMTNYRLVVFVLASILIITACNRKKKPNPSGEDPVEVADFIGFFPQKALPYDVYDTTLAKKEKDTFQVSFANFSRFVPDSVVKKLFGKSTKVKIYAEGRIPLNGGGNFLIARTIHNNRKQLVLFAFDRKDVYADHVLVLQPDQASATTQFSRIDKQFSLTRTVTRKNSDGTVSDGKEVYALDTDSRKFTLVMTDALDEKIAELVNPIDTLPRTHKYAADYSSGKMNLVSVRDSRRGDRIRFFIHFQKNSGACTGELKGEAIFRKPNLAEYRQNGDPCVLQFIFSNSSVTLKEVEGCGSRRGLQCSFNGSYPRKKTPVKKK